MNKYSPRLIFSLLCSWSSFDALAQGKMSFSVPMIWNKVEVKDNWTPSTAPNYTDYLEGSAFGYGFQFGYSLQPKFLIKNESFLFDVGLGYFSQRFNIDRPFDYPSSVEIIYRTDFYIYQNWLWTVGLSYCHQLKNTVKFQAKMSYTELNSFRQVYKPTSSDPSIVNNTSMNFAKALSLSVGIEKCISKNVSVSAHLLIPYIRFSNDKIFKDDPTSFYRPLFSLGASLGVSYNLKTKTLTTSLQPEENTSNSKVPDIISSTGSK